MLITPFTLDVPITFPPLTITMFHPPIPGPRMPAGEYEKINTPLNIPVYSIVNRQQVYKTFSTSQKLIPLFVKLPDEPFSPSDPFHIITAADQFRFDLISYKYYSTVEFAWIILLANNIIDPFHVAIGTKLRIPSYDIVLTRWLSPALGLIL